MIIKGQYTSAKIFTENIEDLALQWIKSQCDHPAFEGMAIAQMPDVHAGNSCNVGTAYRIGAFPNFIIALPILEFKPVISVY